MYLAFLLLQVSVGTLLAFTVVAISVLILRYIPPNQVPIPPSLQDSIAESNMEYAEATKPLDTKEDFSINDPLISKHLPISNCES